MAETQLSDALVFAQDDGTGVGDGEESFASGGLLGLLAQAAPASCIGDGLAVTNVDTANNTVEVSAGYAFVKQSNVTVQSGAQETYDTTLPSSTTMVVVLPSSVTLSLDADAVNDIWLAIDTTSVDGAYMRHGSAVSEPAAPALRLGTADTASGDARAQWYLAADDGTLTFPDEAAVSTAASSLQSGTVVHARDTEQTAVIKSGSVTGVPELTDGDVLKSSQVPDLAITETYTVVDETERLGLDVQEGDVAIQQDNDETYIFTGGDASSNANWSAFEAPPAPVQSVFGRTGDVTPQSGDYSHSDLSGVSEGQHRSTEQVQDIVGSLLSGQGNINLTYDDASDVLRVDTSALNTEEVEDAVASLITGGTGISISYDDGADTLVIDGPAPYSDSDAINAINNDSDHGSTAPHNYFGGSHNDLSGVSAGQHRSDSNIVETVDGSSLSSLNMTGELGVPQYSDPSSGQSNTTEGDIFYSQSDNSLYLNDGA